MTVADALVIYLTVFLILLGPAVLAAHLWDRRESTVRPPATGESGLAGGRPSNDIGGEQ